MKGPLGNIMKQAQRMQEDMERAGGTGCDGGRRRGGRWYGPRDHAR